MTSITTTSIIIITINTLTTITTTTTTTTTTSITITTTTTTTTTRHYLPHLTPPNPQLRPVKLFQSSEWHALRQWAAMAQWPRAQILESHMNRMIDLRVTHSCS
jgi:hypothetical protein